MVKKGPFQTPLEPYLRSTTSSITFHAQSSTAPRGPPQSASSPTLGVLAEYITRHCLHAQVVGKWKRVVSTLKSPTGVPPEVWGAGLSPSEWRTQNPGDLNALRLAAISNFKLVRSQLHARKRKEYTVRSSTYIATREDNLTAGHMHGSFLSILNELPEGVDLQYYDFGTDATPQTPAALHDYVTNMFLSHFRAQCTHRRPVFTMAPFSGKTSSK